MLLNRFNKEKAVSSYGFIFRPQAILAVVFALGMYCPASGYAQTFTTSGQASHSSGNQTSHNSGPVCDPNVVAGNSCTTVGQTAMDCGNHNILACLYPSGKQSGQRWFIAGTDSIPPCTNPGEVLQFNGTAIVCAFNGFPTCRSGQALTYNGSQLSCADLPTAPAPPPPPSSSTPPPTGTYTTMGTQTCTPGSKQKVTDSNGDTITQTCTANGWQ